MYQDSVCKRFFEMLRTIDDIDGVKGAYEHGEIREGDLLFIDTKGADYNGRVCLTRVEGDKRDIYRRVYSNGETITLCCATDGEVIGTHPAETVEIKGIVTGIYRPFLAEAAVDLSEHAGLFEKIRAVKCGKYGMTVDEVLAIAAKNKGGAASSAYDAFNYGFLKGQRAAKRAAHG